MNSRKKSIIFILSAVLIIVIALVIVFFCIKSDNATTPANLINYNNFNNLLKKHDNIYIETAESYMLPHILSKETISGNLDLYMVTSSNTPIIE